MVLLLKTSITDGDGQTSCEEQLGLVAAKRAGNIPEVSLKNLDKPRLVQTPTLDASELCRNVRC